MTLTSAQLPATRTAVRPVTVLDTLTRVDAELRQGNQVTTRFATGFLPLDDHLDGGLHGGDLVLLTGRQAVGKSTFALQVARNIVTARPDASVLYVCYEHGTTELMERLLFVECGLSAPQDGLPRVSDLRSRLAADDGGGITARLQDDPACVVALSAMQAWADRLHLVAARSDRTDVGAVAGILESLGGPPPVVVVDYLQKVHAPGSDTDDERTTRVAEGLKDLALNYGTPVVAIVAADKTGVAPGRTRLHHVRGSSALLYEADVALVLNVKYDIVARHHLVYGAHDIDRYRDYLVCSIEKNRSGRSNVDMQFLARFAHGYIDPIGSSISENLVDQRLYVE